MPDFTAWRSCQKLTRGPPVDETTVRHPRDEAQRRQAAPLNSLVTPLSTVPDRGGTWRASLHQEWLLVAFCSSVAAVALLYNLFVSPDILYDEAAYTWAAQQVALGWHLTLNNQPLFVHPPLMFLLQAGWLRLTGHGSASLPSAIRAARVLAASVGVVDVLLVAALAYRLAESATPRRRRVVTGIVALFAALDPVLVRYDRQDVIEPFALCMSMVVLHAAWAMRNRGTLAYVSVISILSGLSLLTNQITIFLIVVPLLFALLERDGRLIRRSAAALGIGLIFSQIFLLWGIELSLGGSFLGVQTATLRRLIGLIQITGLNMPGVSLIDALRRSITQYSSSYVVLAIGCFALIWCWTRRNSSCGNFLKAWLTASYAFGAYIVAVGTLNEQFFVYILPAAIVGSVMLGDAIIFRWSHSVMRKRDRGRRRVPPLPFAVGTVGFTSLVCLSAVSWVTNYSSSSDGVVQVDHVIATTLPACSAVNASGDPEKYSYLLGSRTFTSFVVGAAAIADGVHYFILAPNDALERNGDMSPALASWIQDHGKLLDSFPSQVYKTVQLWYVRANPYDAVEDIADVSGGVFVNTVGSHCGGYTVTDGSSGSFYSGYQTLGGKSVIGDPMSRTIGLGNGGHEQLFDGAVLIDRSNTGLAVRALPIVAMLANRSLAAYRRTGLPPIIPGAAAAQRRSWLTNQAITRVYLGGDVNSPRTYAAAIQRYGEPLGPPSVGAGGVVSQPFADVVLQVAPRWRGIAHAAAVTQDALDTGVLKRSALARVPQPPPPLPNPAPSGPAEPTSVEPFVLTLIAVLAFYGFVLSMLMTLMELRERRRPVLTDESRWNREVAS